MRTPRADLPPIRRRALLGAAAWTAPAVAVAVAAPAYASSLPDINKLATLNKYPPSVGTPHAGEIELNTAQIWYDPNVWGTSPFPSTAVVNWRVYVVRADTHETVFTFVDSVGVEISTWGNSTTNNVFARNLAAGPYLVISEISSVSYTPNPVGTVWFSTPPSSQSTPVTVW